MQASPVLDHGGIAQKLRGLSAAEDFFAALEVPYDPQVLRVARLHILRRMGEYLDDESLEALPEPEAAARAQATLRRAYEDFAQKSPLTQRVFRVLKDHDPSRPVPAKTAFLDFDDIAPVAPRRDAVVSRS